jgi:hypothetical protein
MSSLEIQTRKIPSTAPQLAYPEISWTNSFKSNESSISKVDASRIEQKNVFFDLLNAHLKFEKITQNCIDLFEIDMNESLDMIQKLENKKKEELFLQAENVKSQNTWKTLGTVSTYLASISSIALGISSYGVSSLAASLLIASGGLGLVNQVSKDTGLYDAIFKWSEKSLETQQKIKNQIDMGLFLVQMGAGLCGAVTAVNAGAIHVMNTNPQGVYDSVAASLNVASTLSSVGSKIGTAHFQKEHAHLVSQMKKTSTELTSENWTLSDHNTKISKMLQLNQNQTEELKKAIHSLQMSLD